MALMDEFREERESIKNKPLKDKIGYIIDYYKWPIIGVVVAIIAVSSFIYTKTTAKEDVLSGMLLNTYAYGSTFSEEDFTKISDEFLGGLNLNTDQYELTLNKSITYLTGDDATANYYNSENLMVIMAQVAAGALDFMTGDADAMTELAYKDYFIDLSEVLSEEEYAAYEPYFLYMDKAFQTQLSVENTETLELATIEYPDCTIPDAMEDPVPIFIDMSQCEKLQEIYGNPTDETIVFGFTVNMTHKENTLKFLEYILPIDNEE